MVGDYGGFVVRSLFAGIRPAWCIVVGYYETSLGDGLAFALFGCARGGRRWSRGGQVVFGKVGGERHIGLDCVLLGDRGD